jgi:hypothetical protein
MESQVKKISSGQVGINKVNWGAEVTLIFIK